jgi:hypothetical protein
MRAVQGASHVACAVTPIAVPAPAYGTGVCQTIGPTVAARPGMIVSAHSKPPATAVRKRRIPGRILLFHFALPPLDPFAASRGSR